MLYKFFLALKWIVFIKTGRQGFRPVFPIPQLSTPQKNDLSDILY